MIFGVFILSLIVVKALGSILIDLVFNILKSKELLLSFFDKVIEAFGTGEGPIDGFE